MDCYVLCGVYDIARINSLLSTVNQVKSDSLLKDNVIAKIPNFLNDGWVCGEML